MSQGDQFTVGDNLVARRDIANDQLQRAIQFFNGCNEFACPPEISAFSRSKTSLQLIRVYAKAFGLASFPDDETVAIILNATGLPMKGDQDHAIRVDLGAVRLWLMFSENLESVWATKKRIQYAERVRVAATRMIGLLNLPTADLRKMDIEWTRLLPVAAAAPAGEDPEARAVRLYTSPRTPHFRFSNLLEELADLKRETEMIISETNEAPVWQQKYSPLDYSISILLVEIFEQRFGRKAGHGNKGPFSRFAVAALTAMERGCSLETVARARTVVGSKISRRSMGEKSKK